MSLRCVKVICGMDDSLERAQRLRGEEGIERSSNRHYVQKLARGMETKSRTRAIAVLNVNQHRVVGIQTIDRKIYGVPETTSRTAACESASGDIEGVANVGRRVRHRRPVGVAVFVRRPTNVSWVLISASNPGYARRSTSNTFVLLKRCMSYAALRGVRGASPASNWFYKERHAVRLNV